MDWATILGFHYNYSSFALAEYLHHSVVEAQNHVPHVHRVASETEADDEGENRNKSDLLTSLLNFGIS